MLSESELKKKLQQCKEAQMSLDEAIEYLEIAPEKDVAEYLESIQPSIEKYKEIMDDKRPGPDTPGVVNLFPDEDKKK